MKIAQRLFGVKILPAVDAILGATIADEVFDVGDDMLLPLQIGGRALQASHHLTCVVVDDGRILGVALIGPPPAIIPRHRHRGGEGPIQAGGRHFASRDLADAENQLRIASRPQTDVVGEQGCREDVIVAVYRIGRPHEGNAKAPPLEACFGRQPILIRLTRPIRRRSVLVVVRPATAAIEYGANLVLGDLLGRHLAKVRLNHLADLFLQRHLGEQRLDPLLHGFILGDGAVDLRPLRKVRQLRELRDWGLRIGQPGACHTTTNQQTGQRPGQTAFSLHLPLIS